MEVSAAYSDWLWTVNISEKAKMCIAMNVGGGGSRKARCVPCCQTPQLASQLLRGMPQPLPCQHPTLRLSFKAVFLRSSHLLERWDCSSPNQFYQTLACFLCLCVGLSLLPFSWNNHQNFEQSHAPSSSSTSGFQQNCTTTNGSTFITIFLILTHEELRQLIDE